MSNLNSTPSANRTHIGFFGSRNAGKSSLVNAVCDQDIAVVSDTLGTTTDPVQKSMEILPLGPVVIIDTPGFDDEGELGRLRVQKTEQVLSKTDIAVLVVDAQKGKTRSDEQLLKIFADKKIPHLVVYNKSDLGIDIPLENGEMKVSAKTRKGIDELKNRLALIKPTTTDKSLFDGIIKKGDTVVLVCPIDESAPKGRLILPQVQAIRSLLDGFAIAVVVKETELALALDSLKNPPALVVCDSQVFKKCDEIVPKSVPLTSFSILMARFKGFLATAVTGISALKSLENGDKILISEGCTHHRQCGDIGTVKIPTKLKAVLQKDLNFEFTSGTEFPRDLSQYKVVIHCGACMLNEREVASRKSNALSQNVPFTNYGITLAFLSGILERSIEIFPDIKKLL